MREPASEAAGLYVHLPFCVVRCAYCDFYSLTGQDDLAEAYVGAVGREIREFPARTGYRPPITSLYIGGGTPSHLPAGSVSRILDAVFQSFGVSEDAEITVEANPESAGAETLREFVAAGANRLSLGVQSFEPRFLAMMGRPHGPDAAERAVAGAREAGFANVSLDLIYGLPGQDRELWSRDLARAIELATEHLSVYLLETDKETPLARLIESGVLGEPDASTIEDLYLTTETTLGGAGFARYEVSNWSKPRRASRHNLGYWTDAPYLGFGSSAHSYFHGRRWACRLSAQAYIDAVDRRAETRLALDDGSAETRVAEAIVTALRLAEGADLGAIGRRYGFDLWTRYASELEDLARRGWALLDPPKVRLTALGILWSMEALTPFVSGGASHAGSSLATRTGAP